LIKKQAEMNWKLIFALSLFGLAMAFATVYWIPSNMELFIWLPIFLVCAYFIAKNAHDKYFLHGFLLSIINCMWMTVVHIKLSKAYIANHPEEAKVYADTFAKTSLSMHKTMLIMGGAIGLICGIVLGLLSFAASRMLNKKR